METRRAKTRFVAMVVVFGLLAYALIATGGSLEPSAPPGPTMKTLSEVEPRIAISSLPYTISTSGSYYITGDLTLTDTTANGITINADNVTIDLMGHSLVGPGSGSNHGIYMKGRRNVEVRNGTVRGFGAVGIYDASYPDWKGPHRVIAVRAVSNGSYGIHLYSIGNLVKDCTAAENGEGGIFVFSGSTVTGNTACYNQGHGIAISSGCTVTGNAAEYNQLDGISFAWGNNLVDQNTAYLNNQSGGSYVNMDIRTDCTYGVNHAP